MSAGGGRKLNALEQKIHQTVLNADDKTLAIRDIDSLSSDASARTQALNFLLSAGMLKMMQDSHGKPLLKAVGRKEMDMKKDLTAEESMVLSHITASGNEGIWTKHIKVKTDLHQTVIDRCLKSLTQKQLVKAVKGSVQHPTRKMYMLFHLEPSVEVTGGPWYTDKELDTEFIKLLSAACLKFIRDRSFPRASSSRDESTTVPPERLLYQISNAPSYPSSQQIQQFLNKSRITETQLTVEHVEMLLGVLVLDGVVEKIPAMAAALWDSGALGDDGSSESEDDRKSKKKNSTKKKRKRDDEDRDSKKKKKKHRRDSDSDDDSDESEDEKEKRKKKRKKSRESRSEDEDEKDRKKDKRKKRRKVESDDESGSDNEDSDVGSRKSKKSKKSKRKYSRKYDSSSSSSSDSDSDSDSPPPSSRSRSRSKSKSLKHSRSHSPSGGGELFNIDSHSAHVYRAVHQESLLNFGWNQAPCGKCPQFDFCVTGGPVNPKECVYYDGWLGREEAKT
ncbi:RNA polymerase Rpc34 subunit-domain-containing protein [Abortiporus biennis]|nr:RNA polymerase Rpc34 subunit-domain-containing protein [Abortiporus biennis]